MAEGPLAGRTALVTGAGSPSGIGFATARLLGERGAAVAINNRLDLPVLVRPAPELR